MIEGITRLLGELRSADLFINALACGNEGDDAEEGQSEIIVKQLINSIGVVSTDGLPPRLLNATAYGLRFVADDSDRLPILSATARMLKSSTAVLASEKSQTNRCTGELLEERNNLLQEASHLVEEGCKLLASSLDAKESMKERLTEARKRDSDVLRAAGKQCSAAFDTEISSALQKLVEQEDALLQVHLTRVFALIDAATGTISGKQTNTEKLLKAIDAHGKECNAHFKQAVKDSITTMRQHLGRADEDGKSRIACRCLN